MKKGRTPTQYTHRATNNNKKPVFGIQPLIKRESVIHDGQPNRNFFDVWATADLMNSSIKLGKRKL